MTSIRAIALRIREVFAQYPDKQAGITLANSFPSLSLPARCRRPADIAGSSSGCPVKGSCPITYLTLARVADLGLVVSGNGGAMDHRAAAGFLALGASTVQFCTAVMKYGLGVVDELESGLSYYLAARGMKSVQELIGSSAQMPIIPFEDLSGDQAGAVAQRCPL